jgi:hypothetical protein
MTGDAGEEYMRESGGVRMHLSMFERCAPSPVIFYLDNIIGVLGVLPSSTWKLHNHGISSAKAFGSALIVFSKLLPPGVLGM